MNYPLISVIIPTYNRANYLDQTISSALAQYGDNYEIIISDNCSTDTTQEVVAKYLSDERVRYFRNAENVGMVNNWRRAVYEYARGSWFMILSDDDYLIDDKYLSKASLFIENESGLVLVYAGGYLLNEKTQEKTQLKIPFSGVTCGKEVFLSRGKVKPQDITLCNVVFNREASIDLSAFANPNNVCCDSELFLKLCLKGNVAVASDEPVSVYRFHDSNLLKAISLSPQLVRGNIDHFLNPYLFAKEAVSLEFANEYAKNIEMIKFVEWTLLVLGGLSFNDFVDAKRFLGKNIPDICKKLYWSPVFWLKFLLVILFGARTDSKLNVVRKRIKSIFRVIGDIRRKETV